MEMFLSSLIAAIAAGMDLDNLVIDEDCGQLEGIAQGLDQYPVTFPCVLISAPECQFSNLANEVVQRGKMKVSVRLAFDVYSDTRYGSGQESEMITRMQHNKKLTSLINRKSFEGASGKMVRTFFQSYSMPHGVKVYETVYEATVSD